MRLAGAPKPVEPTPVTAQGPQVKPADTAKPQQSSSPSDEYYRKTFAEVQEVIAALTKIISAGDYRWVAHLPQRGLRERPSSPEFLAKASNSGVLKKNGIVLKNLKDYFNKVVVRSQMQATLDDITFVDATHVKALTEIQGSPIILHYLEREEGRWKVGIQRAGAEQLIGRTGDGT